MNINALDSPIKRSWKNAISKITLRKHVVKYLIKNFGRYSMYRCAVCGFYCTGQEWKQYVIQHFETLHPGWPYITASAGQKSCVEVVLKKHYIHRPRWETANSLKDLVSIQQLTVEKVRKFWQQNPTCFEGEFLSSTVEAYLKAPEKGCYEGPADFINYSKQLKAYACLDQYRNVMIKQRIDDRQKESNPEAF